MSDKAKMVKQDTLLLAVLVTFVCGFLSGAVFAVYKLGPKSVVSSAPNTSTSKQQNNITAQQSDAIIELAAEVTKNPNNLEAWTRLGHLYYDTNQPKQAIRAYTKSLEINDNDANVWTDLGVMYRRAGDSNKAIESFDKASQINPKHEPSRMNKGVVVMYDLNDVQGAIKIWQKLLEINPNAVTPSGQPLKLFIEDINK